MADLTPAEHDEAFLRATERVRARLGLIGHAALWLVVGLVLLVLNVVATPGLWWFYWPVAFWLLALALHVGAVYGPGPRLIERWRDRELRRELARLRDARTRDRSA
ncbi:MAG: 2TM domain-containing protein [Actinobacteria bacterium]|nr:2TM domain-containing protein [Actinomycetota bacterium]